MDIKYFIKDKSELLANTKTKYKGVHFKFIEHE